MSEAPLLPVVPGPTRLVVEPVLLVSRLYDVRTLDDGGYIGLRLTRAVAERLLALTRSAEAAEASLGASAGACRVTLADRTNPPFSIQLTPEAEAAFDRRILDWGVADPGDVQRDFGPLPADVTASYMDVAWECQGSVHERTYWLEIVRVVDYLAGKADAFPRLRKEGK